MSVGRTTDSASPTVDIRANPVFLGVNGTVPSSSASSPPSFEEGGSAAAPRGSIPTSPSGSDCMPSSQCTGARTIGEESTTASGKTEDVLHPDPGSTEVRTVLVVAAGNTSEMALSPPEALGSTEIVPMLNPGRVMGCATENQDLVQTRQRIRVRMKDFTNP